ncbi:MAG: hypothetical protein JWN66_114 [Sphingomonas bacterium]|uniref:imm11 family protein n=1 Tax=Sphingomonas bacterium TaxID=1895847 RepID=UPI0026315E3C|nr:DUF1629 domain-containing protein [Sphingomonas bacterium]MDB5702998.1 hypothetical protein [Sphingomonas bacterium]
MNNENEQCWALFLESDGVLSISSGDLRYFHAHFCGESLGSQWKGPPDYTILGSRKPINDFVSWHVAAPIVSPPARRALEKISSDIEFLPFGTLKGKQYFAANITKTIDAVDFERSDIQWLSGVSEGLPGSIVIRSDIVGLPALFKLDRIASQIYLSQEAAEYLMDAGLTGFSLLRPSTNIAKRVIQSGSLVDYRQA